MSGRSFYEKKRDGNKNIKQVMLLFCGSCSTLQEHSPSPSDTCLKSTGSEKSMFMFCFVRFVFFGFSGELGVFSSLHSALKTHKQLYAHIYELVKYHHHAITHTITIQSDIPAVAIKVALLFALKVIPMFFKCI